MLPIKNIKNLHTSIDKPNKKVNMCMKLFTYFHNIDFLKPLLFNQTNIFYYWDSVTDVFAFIVSRSLQIKYLLYECNNLFSQL